MDGRLTKPHRAVPGNWKGTEMKYPLYEVHADEETGKWFGEPETIGERVDSARWAKMPDGAHYICTTYEADSGETRALKVWFVPKSEQ
jgi:hypothetical protein